MMRSIDRRHFTQIMQWLNIRKLFTWWVQTLAPLLPSFFRQRIHAKIALTDLYFRDGQIALVKNGKEGSSLDAEPVDLLLFFENLSTQERTLRRVRLLVDHKHVLKVQLRLPRSAAKRLDNVIQFEIDKHIPFKAEQVKLSYTVADDAKNNRVVVSILIIPKAQIDPVLAILEQQQIQCVEIGLLKSSLNSSRDYLTIPLVQSRSTGMPLWVRGVYTSLLLTLLALGSWFPLDKMNQVLNKLNEENQQLRQQLAEVNQIKTGIEQLTVGINSIDREKRQNMEHLAWLRGLSESLPKNSWLTELSVRDKQVQMVGTSAQAAAIIPVLEASPFFQQCEFVTPITKTTRENNELFTIRATLTQASGNS